MEKDRISELLQPFGIQLDTHQMGQLRAYLRLLLRWNEKINLTSIRDPEECVVRHFGESLVVSHYENLQGHLVDIGSGAGFPGLALKMAFPHLQATLLEPIAKKRAFLKEVARCCEMDGVEVRHERLEQISGLSFEVATCRAVGGLNELVKLVGPMLVESGRLHLWITRHQAAGVMEHNSSIDWVRRLPLPMSREREILTGVHRSEVLR